MAGSITGKSTGLQLGVPATRARRAINRKIWVPKLFYDALPWFYAAAGVAALIATLYIGDWYWIVPHSLLVSAACIHLALFVFIRRHRGQSEADDAA